MRHEATEARVRRAIGACREQGIEATPEVVAQIMAGEDGLAASHEAGTANAHADYLRAATWVLLLFWLYLMANVLVLGAEVNWWFRYEHNPDPH